MSFLREQIAKKLTRSSKWPKIRKAYLKSHKKCEACRRKHFLEVHHIEDFSTYPELELDFDNLITLCSRCHFLLGHLNYWKSINPDIVIDAKILLDKIKNRR